MQYDHTRSKYSDVPAAKARSSDVNRWSDYRDSSILTGRIDPAFGDEGGGPLASSHRRHGRSCAVRPLCSLHAEFAVLPLTLSLV